MNHNIQIKENLSWMIGKQYGRMTVIGIPFRLRIDQKKRGLVSYYNVVLECNCGNVEVRQLGNVLSPDNKILNKPLSSCKSCRTSGQLKHGLRSKQGTKDKTKLYNTWSSMKARVKNPYKHAIYLEKGIEVCDEWANDFEAFYSWSINNGYYDQPKNTPKKDVLSIDRINSDGNYCPANCRWVTCSENSKKVGTSNYNKKSFMRRKIKYLENLLKENDINWKNDDELTIQFENDKAKTRKKNQDYGPNAKRNSDTL